MYVYCIPQFTMYDILCTHQASPCRQGDVYSMTIAHHWNSGEQTIPMRYGTAIEELIRRSSALETPPNLAHPTSDSRYVWRGSTHPRSKRTNAPQKDRGRVQPQPKYIKSNLSKSYSSQLSTHLSPVQLPLLL